MARAQDGSVILHEGAGLQVGVFHLSPTADRWREPNNVGEGYYVVFPGTAVRIVQEGRGAVVADPNVAVLYEPFQGYTREVVSEAGDHCRFVILTPELLAEITRDDDPTFPTVSRPSPARAYVLARLAVQAARHRGDRLAIEEAALYAVASVLGQPPLSSHVPAYVDATRELLATRFADDLSLGDIAAEVYVSPYHLARRFRASTGSSIHGYRDQLRLRSSMDLLEAGAHIADAAAACGYASHAHFTGRFRRAFGLTPSQARTAGIDVGQMRTFLEAAARPGA